jgi:hypothetical protein
MLFRLPVRKQELGKKKVKQIEYMLDFIDEKVMITLMRRDATKNP